MMMYRNIFENRHGSPYSASCNRYTTVAVAKEQQRGRDDFAWMEYSSDGGKTWIAMETQAVIREIGPVLGTASATPDLYRELAQELVKNEELRLARESMKQAQDALVAQSARLLLAEQEVQKLKEKVALERQIAGRLGGTLAYLAASASDSSDRRAASQAIAEETRLRSR